MLLEAYYRQVLELSQQMLDAASTEQWDRLIDLEKARNTLLQSTPHSEHGEDWKPAAALIREIQDVDAQAKEIVSTWLEHAKILLRIK